jgi:hypothetical protein
VRESSIVRGLNLFKDRTAISDVTRSTGQTTSAGVATGLGRRSLTSHLIAKILTLVPQGRHRIDHVTTSPTAHSDLTTLAVSHSTARPASSPTQHSSARNRLRTAWHGVEQLLQKVGKCLDGTPFKAPISALNVLIEVTNVCCHLPASQHT